MLTFTDLTPETIDRYVETVIQRTRAVYDQIASMDVALLSFETVLRPIITTEGDLVHERCIVGNVNKFHPDKAVREASVAGDKKLSEFDIECSMREDVFSMMFDYYSTIFPSEKAQGKLTAEEERLVEKAWRTYRRNGLHLDTRTVDEVKGLMQEISTLCIQYQNNVNEENTKLVFSRAQLEGLPETWFHSSKLASDGGAGPEDRYTVTLKYPDYFPVMKYCHDSEVRRQMYCAFNSRCAKVNGRLLDEIVLRRDQLARKLGYKCYSDYALEVKMAKTTDYVMKFQEGLIAGFEPLIRREYDELQNFARQRCGDGYELQRWDLAYYTRLYKEAKYSVDMEVIRQYFPLQTVMAGMFRIYERLLGLRFVEEETENKWHEAVRMYNVFDGASDGLGPKIGTFYLDLHPRDGKYGHAAIIPFITGCDLGGERGRRLAVATMVCNFPEHECLQFSDVVTLFHEFGHVMHHVCSRTQLAEFSGFSVEGDFVEAPSQMLEFWCYESDALRLLSGHKDSGETLPQEYVDKLDEMDKADAGFFNRRQLFLGKYDMMLHCRNYSTVSDVDSHGLYLKLDQELTLMATPTELHVGASFGHLVGGYEAGYYGYLLAETYATDMFYTKFKGRVLDPEAGAEYRAKILRPGSSRDALDSLRDFLGREPNETAFLIEKGLPASAPSSASVSA